MVIEVITNASFFISAVAFFALSLLFGDALLLRFELKTFIKSLGFILLGTSSVINLINHDYTAISIWMMAGALYLIYASLVLDPLSKLKYLLPLPLIFFFFLSGHMLLFAIGVITTIAVFQLAYTTQHRDFIPFGAGFILLSVGEYLYYLETTAHLNYLSAGGSFLYLFASLVLLAWAWSYLAIRFVNLLKSG